MYYLEDGLWTYKHPRLQCRSRALEQDRLLRGHSADLGLCLNRNMAAALKFEGSRTWWLILCVAYMVANLQVLVLGQIGESNSYPTTFMTNYASGSDSQHFRVLNSGQQVQLILDEYSASGFGSKYKYLFGRIGIRMKLVPGDSAGTVTAYYMSSQTARHDEMDFEFLGNVSGQPYQLQTNIFAGGKGEREQRIFLWFDPTADFHEYSVLWNQKQIVFYVDDTPIRVFKNNKQSLGIDYPDSQPVGIYSTIWNGENWATNDGWVKLNWTHAPFVATYEKFNVDACLVVNGNTAPCIQTAQSNNWWEQSAHQTLGVHEVDQLNWIRKFYLVYNYCTDRGRNPTPPAECAVNVL